VDLLGTAARKKGLDLLLHYAVETPTRFLGDQGRIRQVLMNLIGNAIKFTAAGHVLVTVRHERATNGMARLAIAIEDTGIGIPADKVGDLFTMFSQVDASTTRKYGGTGLGLAISRRLVKLMHGEVHVTSELGRGSTFEVEVDLELDPQPASPVPAAVEVQGRRVLVVDDNAVNRRIINEQLQKHGVRCTLVASGHEALAALDATHGAGTPFDVVLLDFQMPEMDGGVLAGEIQAHPTHRGIPRVMLSSVQDPIDPRTAAAVGIVRLMVKPVRESHLVAAIARIVGNAAHSTGDSRREGRSAERVGGAQRRVLLVEDNPINQMVARRMLEKIGCDVVVAGDGQQALTAAGAQAFDLVLMDVQMPVMDGYAATTELRRREALAGMRTPIVALTANAMEGDAESCVAAGMDDHVAKPIRTHELAAIVAKWSRGPQT